MEMFKVSPVNRKSGGIEAIRWHNLIYKLKQITEIIFKRTSNAVSGF